MKTLSTYYKSKSITVRNSTQEDCFEISRHMRKQSIDEAWQTYRLSPIETTLGFFKKSTFCFTLDRNGFAVAIFGVIPRNMVGDSALIWMICTDGVTGIENTFVRNSKNFIDLMLGFYPFLYSYVSVDNELSLKWLKYIGATLSEVTPQGINKKLFHYIYFMKER